jgi:hypothetical protein
MKKQLCLPLLAALSLLLCGFAAAPSPASDGKPSMKIEITTAIASDGSGSLEYKVTLSKEMLDMLQDSPGFTEDAMCDSFFETGFDDWDQSQSDFNGTLACSAEIKFDDLDEMESMIKSDFSGARFEQLEIKDDTLYYDLAPHTDGESLSQGLETGFSTIDIEAWWIVEAPGDVKDSNADKTSGRTLKWDLLKLTPSSHVKFEAATSGGGLGMDPTLAILLVVGLMGCCCLVVLVIGVAVFFFLRRKKAPESAAA